MELSKIRDEIDITDKKLKENFLERMNLVEKVLEYKKENNLPVKNQKREEELINNLTCDLDKYKEETKRFFKDIIDISCTYQEKGLKKEQEIIFGNDFYNGITKVYYAGAEGAYAHEAALKKFSDKEILNENSFKKVIDKVIENENSVGVLPFENLIGGRVWEVLKLLVENDLYITDKMDFNIDHCLLGLSDFKSIKTVESHPQALAQCESFIKENNFEKKEKINTATAAKELSDKTVGVIGSRLNAKLYNLKILKENISDITDNKTRFVIVSKNQNVTDNADTISLTFTLQHKVGSLQTALNEFSNNGLNLSFIQSVPLCSNKWEYRFFADVNGNLKDKEMINKIKNIEKSVENLKILGNY